jgi:malate dehydrogenase
MNKKRIKVVVTGSAGQIGYALLFRIASGQMFGNDTEVELHCLELEAGMPALKGVVMELEDCAFPLLKNIVATPDLKTAMNGVNWAILVGSVPRKAGMERKDLLQINGGIFTKQGQAINDYAAKDVRVLVVGNPCNTNCMIAMKNAKDVPSDRFYAMTMLDQKRAAAQLAMKAQVDVDAVTDMIIWGNHSATQFPDFYHAKINGQNATDVIKDEHWLQTNFIETVQKRGAQIINARGASSAASAANSIIASVNALIYDTEKNNSYSMCKVSQGEYDVDPDLIFSFPCQTRAGKLEVVQNISHNTFAQNKINITLDELRSERDQVKELGLID